MFCVKPLVVVLATTPGVLCAQTHCADRDAVVDRLEVKYGESFSGGGIRNEKSIYEVWMSEENGTWTILLTRADGKSCIVASGTDWRDGLKVPAGIPG
ncbi:MAG: hypothetical protein OIF48_15545 [Silicimonas sp.]|nr:hypothetical protein [Silicimonas sp.]